jgi:hypothetical protein
MKSKWKMVSFRLSAADYAEALKFCRASGYRSMSSFALSAMRALVPAIPPSHDVAKERCELSRHVDHLSATVKRLMEAVGTEPICQANSKFKVVSQD